MRNLKKILALVLALVMSLSLVTVANAAYSDEDSIGADYKEAVDVLTDLGVFRGTSSSANTFEPTKTITRAEVAAILYRINTGDVDDSEADLYKEYVGNYFTDHIAKWAEPYVGYCANAEIYKGVGNKTFAPDRQITGYEVLATMLRALGYDKNGEFTGKQWSIQTAAKAKELGITDGITSTVLAQPAQRQLVAKLLLRTMLCDTVTYNAIKRDYDKSGVTLAYDIFKMQKVEKPVLANKDANLEGTSCLADTVTKIGDYTVNVASSLDDIGMVKRVYIKPDLATSVDYDYEALGDALYEIPGQNNKTESYDGETAAALAKTINAKVAADTEYYRNYDPYKDAGTAAKTNVRMEYVIELEDMTEYEAKYLFVTNGTKDNSKLELKNADGTYTACDFTAASTEYANPVTGWDRVTDRDWRYTKSITMGTVLSATDDSNIKTIFTKADRHNNWVVGEVYVYTTAGNRDVSDYISYETFLSTYFTKAVDPAAASIDGSCGNRLIVIDNDKDGLIDYVLVTEYCVDIVKAADSNGVPTALYGPNDGLTGHQTVTKPYGYWSFNNVTSSTKFVNEGDALKANDVVTYAVIDGKARVKLATSVTTLIDSVNRVNATCTAGSNTYEESDVHEHSATLASGVANMGSGVSYTLYLDRGGYLAAYTESTENGKLVLLVDGWSNLTATKAEYYVKAWSNGAMETVAVASNPTLFVRSAANDWNGWGRIKTVTGLNQNVDATGAETDNIHTMLAYLRDGNLIPVDRLYQYSKDQAIISTGKTIPGDTYTSYATDTVTGTVYNTGVYSPTAYDQPASSTVAVRALSNTQYYVVYRGVTTGNFVVREYVGYNNLPLAVRTSTAIENVYAAGNRATAPGNTTYYTAEAVVIEMSNGFERDTEQVFIAQFGEVINGITMDNVEVIRGNGTKETVKIDLVNSTLTGYANAGSVNSGYLPGAGLYYMDESDAVAGTYVVRPMTALEIANSGRYVVGYVNKTATVDYDYATIDQYVNVGGAITSNGSEIAVRAASGSKYYGLSYATSLTTGLRYATLTETTRDAALTQNPDPNASKVDACGSKYNELAIDGYQRNEVLVAYNPINTGSLNDILYVVSFAEYTGTAHAHNYAQDVWFACLPAGTSYSAAVQAVLKDASDALAANTKTDLEAALAKVNAALAATPAPTAAEKAALEAAKAQLEAAIKALPAAKRTLTYTDSSNGLVTNAYVVLTKADGTTDKTIDLTTEATPDIGEGICAVTIKTSKEADVKVVINGVEQTLTIKDMTDVMGEDLGWMYAAEIPAGTDAVTVTVAAKSESTFDDDMADADDVINDTTSTVDDLTDLLDKLNNYDQTGLTDEEKAELKDKIDDVTEAISKKAQGGAPDETYTDGTNFYFAKNGQWYGPYTLAEVGPAIENLINGNTADLKTCEDPTAEGAAVVQNASADADTSTDADTDTDTDTDTESTTKITVKYKETKTGTDGSTILVYGTYLTVAGTEIDLKVDFEVEFASQKEIRDTIAAAVKAAKEAAAKTDATEATLKAAKDALDKAVKDAEAEKALTTDEKAAVKEAEDAITAAQEKLANADFTKDVAAALKEAEDAIASGKLADLQAAKETVAEVQETYEDELADAANAQSKADLIEAAAKLDSAIALASATEGLELADALIAADKAYCEVRDTSTKNMNQADLEQLEKDIAAAKEELYQAALAYAEADTDDAVTNALASDKTRTAAVEAALDRASTENAKRLATAKLSVLSWKNIKDVLDSKEALEQAPTEWDYYLVGADEKTVKAAEDNKKALDETLAKIQPVIDTVAGIMKNVAISEDADNKYTEGEEKKAAEAAVEAYKKILADPELADQVATLAYEDEDGVKWTPTTTDKLDELVAQAFVDDVNEAAATYEPLKKAAEATDATAKQKADALAAEKALYEAAIAYMKNATLIDEATGPLTKKDEAEKIAKAKQAQNLLLNNVKAVKDYSDEETLYTLDLMDKALTAIEAAGGLEEQLYQLVEASDLTTDYQPYLNNKAKLEEKLPKVRDAIALMKEVMKQVDLVDKNTATDEDAANAAKKAAVKAYQDLLDLVASEGKAGNTITTGSAGLGGKVMETKPEGISQDGQVWEHTSGGKSYVEKVKGYMSAEVKPASVTLELLETKKNAARLVPAGENKYDLVFPQASDYASFTGVKWSTYLKVADGSFYDDSESKPLDDNIGATAAGAHLLTFKGQQNGADQIITVTIRTVKDTEKYAWDKENLKTATEKVFAGDKVTVELTYTQNQVGIDKVAAKIQEMLTDNTNTKAEGAGMWGCKTNIKVEAAGPYEKIAGVGDSTQATLTVTVTITDPSVADAEPEQVYSKAITVTVVGVGG